ncbi:MAG: hypothetical protein Q4G49_03245 [Paracoccus sp. (in: a-proteobacteria)]|nr:hypothetical protein [Paracoccus sp. (in: a-proteobacteria)]
MSNHDAAELALSLLNEMSEPRRSEFLVDQLVKIDALELIAPIRDRIQSHMTDLIYLRYSDDVVSAARSALGTEDAA